MPNRGANLLPDTLQETVATHSIEIKTLQEGQEELRNEVRGYVTDIRGDIKTLASTVQMQAQLRGKTNWNTIAAWIGLGFPLVGGLFFIIYREMDHAKEIQNIKHNYIEQALAHNATQVDEVDSRMTVAEQLIKSNAEKSEWRKGATDARIDELQRWIAQEYRIRAGFDMPRAEPINRGPTKTSDTPVQGEVRR